MSLPPAPADTPWNGLEQWIGYRAYSKSSVSIWSMPGLRRDWNRLAMGEDPLLTPGPGEMAELTELTERAKYASDRREGAA